MLSAHGKDRIDRNEASKFPSLLINTICNWMEGAGFKHLSYYNDYNFLEIENESDQKIPLNYQLA